MTITLTLDLQRALAEEARRRGTTPELLAVDCLRERFIRPARDEPPGESGTLADFLRDHIGALASGELVPGGAQMSQDTGKKFAEGLLQKRRQGRL